MYVTQVLSRHLYPYSRYLRPAFLLLLAGTILGLVMPSWCSEEVRQILIGRLNALLAAQMASEGGIGQAASAAGFVYGCRLLLLFLGGFFLLSPPLVAVFLLGQGLALGVSAYLLCSGSVAAGAIIFFLAVLPAQLLLLPVWIVGSSCSAGIALLIGRGENIRGQTLAHYCSVFLCLLIVLAGASFLQGLAYDLVLPLFISA